MLGGPAEGKTNARLAMFQMYWGALWCRTPSHTYTLSLPRNTPLHIPPTPALLSCNERLAIAWDFTLIWTYSSLKVDRFLFHFFLLPLTMSHFHQHTVRLWSVVFDCGLLINYMADFSRNGGKKLQFGAQLCCFFFMFVGFFTLHSPSCPSRFIAAFRGSWRWGNVFYWMILYLQMECKYNS